MTEILQTSEFLGDDAAGVAVEPQPVEPVERPRYAVHRMVAAHIGNLPAERMLLTRAHSEGVAHRRSTEFPKQ